LENPHLSRHQASDQELGRFTLYNSGEGTERKTYSNQRWWLQEFDLQKQALSKCKKWSKGE
jgi:hypothetical protein